MKKLILLSVVFSMMMGLSACGKQQNNSKGGSSDMNESEDYGQLIIQDIDVWYGNKFDFLEIQFTKPEYESKITYEFKTTLIEFEDNTVKQTSSAERTLEVTAKTKYHETKFNVNLHNQPAHASDIGYFALDRQQRGFGKGQVLFVGDSFFDPRYENTWHNFYNDVSSDDYQVFCSGSAGSKIAEWRGLAQKMIYTPAPKYILMNCGSNDFWDGGATVESVVNHFSLLMKDIHKHLPEAQIFFFSMINREGSMGSDSAAKTAQTVKDFNTQVQEVISKDNLVTYVDIYDHFVYSDGSAKGDLLKDGCHPKDTEYKYIVQTAIAAGAPIKYIGE